MIGMSRLLVVVVVVIALVSAACAAVVPSGSAGVSTSPGPTSTVLETGQASASAPTPEPSPEIAFRALDTPTDYMTSSAEAVDGTTAVGWVQVGIADEHPAIWDLTTGALRVLDLPAKFVHPSGDTFVRLEGVSGTTAIGTGVLGTENRGQERAMAWNIETGDLRILDIPDGFTQAEAHDISGTTAVGQAWTEHGEAGLPVAWDTETGEVRALELRAGSECGKPSAVSGDTIVGSRCEGDDSRPIVWSPLTAKARDLDLLPGSPDGFPSALDGTTAVGGCCYGEEGTPLPLIWDTATGAVQQLDLPAQFAYGSAKDISGNVVVGDAHFAPLVWDLERGSVSVLSAPAGYAESFALLAVSGREIVGYACEPPASTSENPRCVAAAWTVP